jgi:uncharacterized membrane protein
MKFVIGFLDGWRSITNAFERTLVDNVAATVPWLAPISPAYMAFHNVTIIFGWDVWVAWTIALAVEGLGLAVTSTAFHLWDWNDTKKDKEQSAPFWIAIVTVIFYLAVVITVNVILDVKASPIERTAKALLSLLSVVAAVTLALRSQHARRVEEKNEELEESRAERKEAREFKRLLKLKELENKNVNENLQKLSLKLSESDNQHPASYGKFRDWRHVPDGERLKIHQMRNDVRLVMSEYGVSERTGYNWIGRAEKLFIEEVSQ